MKTFSLNVVKLKKLRCQELKMEGVEDLHLSCSLTKTLWSVENKSPDKILKVEISFAEVPAPIKDKEEMNEINEFCPFHLIHFNNIIGE